MVQSKARKREDAKRPYRAERQVPGEDWQHMATYSDFYKAEYKVKKYIDDRKLNNELRTVRILDIRTMEILATYTSAADVEFDQVP